MKRDQSFPRAKGRVRFLGGDTFLLPYILLMFVLPPMAAQEMNKLDLELKLAGIKYLKTQKQEEKILENIDSIRRKIAGLKGSARELQADIDNKQINIRHLEAHLANLDVKIGERGEALHRKWVTLYKNRLEPLYASVLKSRQLPNLIFRYHLLKILIQRDRSLCREYRQLRERKEQELAQYRSELSSKTGLETEKGGIDSSLRLELEKEQRLLEQVTLEKRIMNQRVDTLLREKSSPSDLPSEPEEGPFRAESTLGVTPPNPPTEAKPLPDERRLAQVGAGPSSESKAPPKTPPPPAKNAGAKAPTLKDLEQRLAETVEEDLAELSNNTVRHLKQGVPQTATGETPITLLPETSEIAPTPDQKNQNSISDGGTRNVPEPPLSPQQAKAELKSANPQDSLADYSPPVRLLQYGEKNRQLSDEEVKDILGQKDLRQRKQTAHEMALLNTTPKEAEPPPFKFLWPIAANPDRITEFGDTNDRRESNKGMTIAFSGRTIGVRAMAPGRVLFRGLMGPLGKSVLINHEAGYSTLYANLESFKVQVGQRLSAGDEIGVAATEGNVGRLHFEVRYFGTPVNPRPLMASL